MAILTNINNGYVAVPEATTPASKNENEAESATLQDQDTDMDNDMGYLGDAANPGNF